MTKVEITLPLSEPLDMERMARLADTHSTYGMYRVRVDPSIQSLRVEYDATRLNPREVHALLAGVGIPVNRPQK